MSSSLEKIFIARLIGLDVFDPLGDRVGRVRDLVMIRRDAAPGPSSSKQPVVVGLVVEVLGKRRVFLPMTRVTSMDSEQVLCTGLVNLRRFEQRGSEILVVGQMFDRTVTMRDGSGTATIIDVGMEQARTGDWQVTQLFVRRTPVGGGLMRRRSGETLVIDWSEATDQESAGHQPATQWVSSHEDDKPADIADELRELPRKRILEIAGELRDDRLADVLQEMTEEDQVFVLTHLEVERGTNAHHIIEACFKALARALREAVSIDPDEQGIPSTKGTLTE